MWDLKRRPGSFLLVLMKTSSHAHGLLAVYGQAVGGSCLSHWSMLFLSTSRNDSEGGHWQLPECQSWEWGDGRAPPWGPLPTLGHVVPSWHLHLLSGMSMCALGCFILCQPEREALRGFETPALSVPFRLPGEMRRWFLCQGSQTQLFPCTMQGISTWSCGAMKAVDCIPWGTARTRVSHVVSDTDHPLLQCGSCRRRVRHCYRQTKGQVELHKSILDTNSCKYLFLCFLK